MKTAWERFENWLKENWVKGFEDLNPPATDQEILALQETIGVQLPAEFVACLKVHNGQRNMAGGLFDNSNFLSTQAVIDDWQCWKDLLDSGVFKNPSEPEAGVKDDWWNPKWIPFANNNSDQYCIDLDPTDAGRLGQVITMWHDTSEREILAESFGSWFEQYVSAVLSGRYKYSEDFGGLIDADYA